MSALRREGEAKRFNAPLPDLVCRLVLAVVTARAIVVVLATTVIVIDMGGLARNTMIVVIHPTSLIFGADVVAIPAARLMPPLFLIAIAIGFPAIGHPMLVLTRLHPAPGRPDMLIVLDLPIARRPRKSRPRCRNDLILRGRWRAQIDVQ